MNGRFILAIIASFFALAFAASGASAQSRTWVSGVGDDLNPCSRTAPCKTFAGAISKTSSGGEISCLDAGGFGSVTIAKSITIDCAGTNGSILAQNTNGIIINAAGIVVTLRNISIDGVATTTGNGIRILNAAAVNIENVVLENFGGTGTSGRGINIETSAANVRVTVRNSSIFNANNDGINSAPTAGNVLLTIDGTTISRGGDSGIGIVSKTTAIINNTTVTNHAVGAGVSIEQSTAVAQISNSTLSDNAFGIFNGQGGAPTTRLYGNTITGNTTDGLHIQAGSVLTYGNNAIRGNTGNETPTGASLGTQ